MKILLEKIVEGGKGPTTMLTFEPNDYVYDVKEKALKKFKIKRSGKIRKEMFWADSGNEQGKIWCGVMK